MANLPPIARRQGPNTHTHAKRGGCIRVFFYTRAVQSWPLNLGGFSRAGQGPGCHPLDPRPASAAYVNACFSMHRHPFEMLMGVPCLKSLALQHSASSCAAVLVHGNEIMSRSDGSNLDSLDRPQSAAFFQTSMHIYCVLS